MPQEYKENDIVDIPGGRSFQLRAGKWEPYSDEHQLAGAAKAVGSGLLHEAIPSTVGAGGDVMQLPKELGIWTGKKLRGLFGGGEQSSDTRSAQEKELEGEGATSVKTALPNSEQVRSVISGVVPEYEPQNFVERGLKTAAGIAPAALASPEAAGARMLPAAGRSLARYAAAPGFASEGVSEIPLVKGSKLEEPLKIMAQILASHGMTRAITPLPATAEQIASGRVLRDAGATATPGQLAGNKKFQTLEAKTADAMLGPGAEEINHRNLQGFTQGTLHHLGVAGENAATPAVRNRINNEIQTELSRLTGRHSVLLDNQLERQLDRSVIDYKQSARLTASDAPEKHLQTIKDLFSTSRRGKPAGWLDGSDYNNVRTDLSNLAMKTDDPRLAKVYRQMRDHLDTKMEQSVAHFNPADAGAFTAVRGRAENMMILERALRGQDQAAAHNLVTPKKLGSAAEHVLGPESYGMETHPLASFARSGERVLTPLKEQPGGESPMRLAMILAGGAAGGLGSVYAGDRASGHDSSPLGYLGGALAGGVGMPLLASVLHSPVGRWHLSNQHLPKSAQPGVRRNPADALLIAEALSRQQRAPAAEKP